jgi:hypothetical protein
MSDDSCIWCHAPVRPCQEAVEWYSYKMASQIGKCGNMGYVQYNYDAGTSLQWYEFTLVRIYIGNSWFPVVRVCNGTSWL